MPTSTRRIGDDEVSAVGFGAMGISAFYGSIQPDEGRLQVRFAYRSPVDSPLTFFRSLTSCMLEVALTGTPLICTETPKSSWANGT